MEQFVPAYINESQHLIPDAVLHYEGVRDMATTSLFVQAPSKEVYWYHFHTALV